MELNKKNMKNIMLLIVFAELFYICVQKINSVAAGVMFVWHIIFPFALGGAIAFILNVPMHALENKLFGKLKEQGRQRRSQDLPVWCFLSFCGRCYLVVLVVLIPEIGSTFTSLSDKLRQLSGVPRVGPVWLTETFQNNDLIEEQFNTG